MAVPKNFIYGTLIMCHLPIISYWKNSKYDSILESVCYQYIRIELLSIAPKLELLYRRQNNIGKRNILPTSFKIVWFVKTLVENRASTKISQTWK